MKTLLTLIIVSAWLISTTCLAKVTDGNVKVSTNSKKIDRMIKVMQPGLDKSKRQKFAKQLAKISRQYKIDPKIMIAIIDTESEFDNSKVSSTGDLSIAQININVWNKELARLKLPTIDSERLVKDEKYALDQMGMILSILKIRHELKDNKWFARYHSRTEKYKNRYCLKVESRIRRLASLD